MLSRGKIPTVCLPWLWRVGGEALRVADTPEQDREHTAERRLCEALSHTISGCYGRYQKVDRSVKNSRVGPLLLVRRSYGMFCRSSVQAATFRLQDTL
jgi:hypothetical protein